MEAIICRCCLKVLSEKSVGLTDSERNMIHVLVPDINFNIDTEARICEKCLEKLYISYGFKASFLGSNESAREVNLFLEDSENANQKSCVFCKAQVYEELVEKESTEFKEVAYKCFPDMDYLCESSSCGSCLSALKDLYAFTKKCLDTEILISKFGKCNPRVLLRKIKLQVSPKLEAAEELVSNVPLEVTDAAEHCVSMKEIKTIMNGKVETPPELLTKEQSPEPNQRRGQKRRVSTTFACKDCDYVAKHRSALASHKLVHKNPSEVAMFKCTECEHKTKRRGDLKAHMKIHTDPKLLPLFYCADCPYFSKRKCELKVHVVIHMDRRFKCKLCCFTTNDELYLNTRHMDIHKDISEHDLFVCAICLYQAVSKRCLRVHMKLKHANRKVMNFKCNWCEFSTSYKQSLRNHMIIHKSKSECETFKCYYCKYESKHKRNLREHIFAIHIQIPTEMFHCAHCSYKTGLKRRLRKHLGVHKSLSEITGFSCDICHRKLRKKASLKRHKISHMREHKMDVQINSLDMELTN